MLDGDDSDSYGDGDIIYYHKDDLTNYSRHLDLNKVSWKNFKFRPMSELGYLDEWRSEDSQDNLPFRAAISEVDKDTSVNENWNMRLGQTKNNFLNRKNRRNKINEALRRKWQIINSLYGDDFRWARGLYSGGDGRPWSVSARRKQKRPEGFYGTLRPIHLRETHLSRASYSHDRAGRRQGNEEFSEFNEFDEERRRKFNRLGLTISQLAKAG